MPCFKYSQEQADADTQTGQIGGESWLRFPEQNQAKARAHGEPRCRLRGDAAAPAARPVGGPGGPEAAPGASPSQRGERPASLGPPPPTPGFGAREEAARTFSALN